MKKSKEIVKNNNPVLLKASEWAKQSGLPREDFLWWDTKEKLITEDRFQEIKKKIGR